MDVIKAVSNAVRECRNQAGTTASRIGPSHQYLLWNASFRINPSEPAAIRVSRTEVPRVTQTDLPNSKRGYYLGVDGQAEVVLPAVLEVGRQQNAFRTAETACDQVGRLLGLDGFISEEVDREIGQSDQPGQQVDAQAKYEEPDCEPISSAVSVLF